MPRVIPKTRPVEAKLIIDALSGASRLHILKILFENPSGLTASEIASRLKLTLPTTLTHLNQLTNAGLVRWVYAKRGRRLIKVYRLVERDLVLNIDLSLLSSVPSLEELNNMLAKFIEEVRKQKDLPPNPSLEDIMSALKVDRSAALALLDYFLLSGEQIVETLTAEAEEMLRDVEEISLQELSKKLRVHEYWAVQVARKLEEKGLFIFERGALKKVIS